MFSGTDKPAKREEEPPQSDDRRPPIVRRRCYRCNKKGHKIAECWTKKREETAEPQQGNWDARPGRKTKAQPETTMQQLQIYWTLRKRLSAQEEHRLRILKYTLWQKEPRKKPWISQGFQTNSKNPVPRKWTEETQAVDLSSANESDQAESLN